MKYLKFAFINIVVFGSLLFLISLLFPNTVNISKSISINSTKQKVITNLVNSVGWNLYAVTVDKVEQQNDSVVIIKHSSATNQLFISNYFIDSSSTINVNWLLQQKLSWYNPIEKFSALIKEKSWLPSMDSSLKKLQQICESTN